MVRILLLLLRGGERKKERGGGNEERNNTNLHFYVEQLSLQENRLHFLNTFIGFNPFMTVLTAVCFV